MYGEGRESEINADICIVQIYLIFATWLYVYLTNSKNSASDTKYKAKHSLIEKVRIYRLMYVCLLVKATTGRMTPWRR